MSIAPKGQNTPVLHRTGYDRDRCKVGIVHIGYGAFHRAHQAIYIDDYMENTGDLRWGIAAVNLRPEETLAFARSKQVSDGYLIKTTDVDGMEELRLVRSHLSYTDWSSTPDVAEQLLAGPDVQLVTITITESGYYLDGNGNLDLSDPVITEEIDRGRTSTIYDFLATALNHRMSASGKTYLEFCAVIISARMARCCEGTFCHFFRQKDKLHCPNGFLKMLVSPAQWLTGLHLAQRPNCLAKLQAYLARTISTRYTPRPSRNGCLKTILLGLFRI